MARRPNPQADQVAPRGHVRDRPCILTSVGTVTDEQVEPWPDGDELVPLVGGPPAEELVSLMLDHQAIGRSHVGALVAQLAGTRHPDALNRHDRRHDGHRRGAMALVLGRWLGEQLAPHQAEQGLRLALAGRTEVARLVLRRAIAAVNAPPELAHQFAELLDLLGRAPDWPEVLMEALLGLVAESDQCAVTLPDSDHGPPPGRLVTAQPAAPRGPSLVAVASRSHRVTTAMAA